LTYRDIAKSSHTFQEGETVNLAAADLWKHMSQVFNQTEQCES